MPAVMRLNARRRVQLGVPTLRPWDMDVDPTGKPALRPYATIEELEAKTSAIFSQVDPQFGRYFETMRAEKLARPGEPQEQGVGWLLALLQRHPSPVHLYE